MIKNLELEQFTVFRQARFEFGKHINVFHGENGTGKTHVLKVLYAVVRGCSQALPSPRMALHNLLLVPVSDRLEQVFRVRGLRSLLRVPVVPEVTTRVHVILNDHELSFDLGEDSIAMGIDAFFPPSSAPPSIFLPTRELLSIYRGFVSLYDNTDVPFEETWRDTCSLLGRPLLRGPALAAIQALLDPLELELGGKVVLGGDDELAIERPDGSRLSAHMEAEGRRKLAMLVRLIANGSITPGSVLFWDEPEANLNAVLLKKIAAILFSLSRAGIQIFVATHSLFLMREIHILQMKAKDTETLDIRYFGLHRSATGVSVEQGPDIANSGDVAALDEELLQSDRYMDVEMRAAIQTTRNDTP